MIYCPLYTLSILECSLAAQELQEMFLLNTGGREGELFYYCSPVWATKPSHSPSYEISSL